MPSAVIPSAHSYPAPPLARRQVHQRCVHPGPLVLGTDPLKTPTPTADRDRTVSRRSEPSSRTTLNGEQPYPWDLLQPQDVMSRHRGAKPPRRYGLLGEISLLSPAYLLSVERWPTHAGPPDHYGRLSSLLDMSVSQSSGLMPLHSNERFPTAPSPPSRASVTLWEATAPVKLPAMRCSGPGSRAAVRHPCRQGWYFKGGSTQAGARASVPTTYPTHAGTNASAKLQ
jgi:hypothetical protein